MKTYIFQADLLCESCGERAARETPKPAGMNPDNESSWDSDAFPKGPFTVGESDCPAHCGHCGIFLENPLTREGEHYVKAALESAGAPDVLETWRRFYPHLTA